MVAELRLYMRTNGYVRIGNLLKLSIPSQSHTVDEIRELLAILLHDFILY
jgi:hypothetical protein